MKKLMLAGAAVLALSTPLSAFAQEAVSGDASANAAVGGAAGGAGGAALGFVLGGPIGAVIGGFTGAVIGAEAGVAASTIEYASANPVTPVYVEGPLAVGYVFAEPVMIYEVPGDATYGYVYANNRVYIVELGSRTVVQSPGYAVPQTTVDYVLANPTVSVSFDGDIPPGYILEGDVEVHAIPDDPSYVYFYVNERPVLIDIWTNTVVWVG